MSPEHLRRVFRLLSDHHGPMHWWPGETPFEVMVGAILTQNTAWSNVERAIAALKEAGPLEPAALLALPEGELAARIRPSGYYNVKARRLRAFCQWLLDAGGEPALRAHPTERLRPALLTVKGIGPETADDILLYALERPVFVVDAYTRRLFSRLGLAPADLPYEALRAGVESALGPDVPLFNELHALIVNHGKSVCRPRPRCGDCILRRDCPAADGI
ncbi:endonuclease III domain-containing protein [Ectothiorhodospira mobilis]|uniref:endonuclease III domain-containing protein n=1 Tax=Ectothiorhodospira mobilis TaxID=195064 RepID=UPI001EE95A75|nr:endonuclease III domain-containing protein [Ectothiorhodospira mobilis]MCG5535103.1 endonuclease III domain-containing protein [Ectothiorhodospira mobilis]